MEVAAPVKRVDVARALYGTLLLVAPRWILRLGDDRPSNRWQRAVVRVLGARHVVQAALFARRPGATARRAGAAVDGLHASTDIACALLDRKSRGAASIDATVAIGFALAGVATAASPVR